MTISIVAVRLLLLIWAISIALLVFTPDEPSNVFQWINVGLVMAASYVFYARMYAKLKSFPWVSISTLFPLSYIIVFFQFVILDLLGYKVSTAFYWFIWADERVVNEAVATSTVGLISFYVGRCLFSKDTKPVSVASSGFVRRTDISFILFFTYSFCVLFYLTAASYLMGGYGGGGPFGGASAATYSYKLFKVGLVSAIIVRISDLTSAYNGSLNLRDYLRHFGWPLIILLAFQLIVVLRVGDRGPLLLLLLLSLGLYLIRHERITFMKALTAILGLSLVLSVIGEVRQSRHSGMGYDVRLNQSLERIGDPNAATARFDTKVPGGQTLELAASVRTLTHALANVPEKHAHTYGLFQIQYLYSIIPGLSGQLNKILHESSKIYDSSSAFITYLIQGPFAESGDGSSVVADLYLDFGKIGVVCGLMVFGIFVGQNEYKLFYGYQPLTFAWIATLFYFANSIYLSRSMLLLELSNIVLIYILIRCNRRLRLK
jgi:hypothetical protein